MAAAAKSPRLALYVREDTQHNMYRLTASVVTLGPTSDYPGLGPRQIRNASDENPLRYRGLYLRDLQAVAYGHEGTHSEERPRSISFHDPLSYDTHRVDRRQAEKMAKTLRTVEGRLAKLIEQQGHPESFGAYLAQLGAALRCEAMIFDDGGRSGNYDDGAHRFHSLGDGVAQVNYIARQWVETGRAVKDRRAA